MKRRLYGVFFVGFWECLACFGSYLMCLGKYFYTNWHQLGTNCWEVLLH